MSRVLALDTTSNFGSIALVENGELVEEMPLFSPEGFSQTLFGHLRALLERHSWELASVDVFAAASGPGSFTGVRVGLTAVKGLAEALEKSAAAVSTLQALAWYGVGDRRAAVLDARRGEIYGAVYDAECRLTGDELVQPFPAWVEALGQVSCVVSPDFSAYRACFPSFVPVIEQRTLSAAVAHLAVGTDPAALDANYVRRSDAELFWTDK